MSTRIPRCLWSSSYFFSNVILSFFISSKNFKIWTSHWFELVTEMWRVNVFYCETFFTSLLRNECSCWNKKGSSVLFGQKKFWENSRWVQLNCFLPSFLTLSTLSSWRYFGLLVYLDMTINNQTTFVDKCRNWQSIFEELHLPHKIFLVLSFESFSIINFTWNPATWLGDRN